MRKLGFGYDRTAKHFKVTRRNVYRWFKQHSVKVERPAQVRKPSKKEKYVGVDWDARFRSKSQQYLRKYLRTKLWYFFKHRMYPSTEKLIGCNRATLEKYLSEKFTGAMRLDNYTVEWEFDHVLSLAHFDLREPDQRLKAFHYTNLQPLSPHDNAVKGHGVSGLIRSRRAKSGGVAPVVVPSPHVKKVDFLPSKKNNPRTGQEGRAWIKLGNQ